jgi:hypothetical protein
MPPTKPTPRGIERPDVPLLGALTLASQRSPPMDGADFNTAHQADGGPDWGSHPQMSDPDWSSARRKGMMFRRLRIRR